MGIGKVLWCDIFDGPNPPLIVRVEFFVHVKDGLLDWGQVAIDPDHMHFFGDELGFIPDCVRLKLIAWVEDCQILHRDTIFHKMICIDDHGSGFLLEIIAVNLCLIYFLKPLRTNHQFAASDDSVGHIKKVFIRFNEPFDPLIMLALPKFVFFLALPYHEHKMLQKIKTIVVVLTLWRPQLKLGNYLVTV